jgi:hypothetical protein
MERRSSQNKRLLKFMRKHGSIAPMKALFKLGIYRLGARIWDLKKQGHNIKSEMVYEGPVKFARYKLIE